MTATVKGLTGEVVRAGDSAYEAARLGWNRLHSRFPEAIVFCATAQDVINAVEWARAHGMAFRARSGRHNLEGWSCIDGGLVIDVSRMKNVTIDHSARTATVGTGLTQLEIVTALGEHGLAVPTGSEGGVGLGGVVLGGGFGLLTRSLGLACDNLIAADVVVADGPHSAKVLHANEFSHPDLLWACRGGGGGNFGIATSYTFSVHELSDVTLLIARWPGHGELAALLRQWQADAPHADEKLTSAIEVDSSAVELSALRHGGSREQLLDELSPLLAIGDPELTFIEGPWSTVYRSVDRGPDDVALWKFYSQFVTQPFPDDAIDMVVDFMGRTPQPGQQLLLLQLRWRGATTTTGWFGLPAPGGPFLLRAGCRLERPGPDVSCPGLGHRILAGTAPLRRRRLRQRAQRLGRGLGTRVLRHPIVDRLRAIKSVYDPGNIFTFEQSVPVVA